MRPSAIILSVLLSLAHFAAALPVGQSPPSQVGIPPGASQPVYVSKKPKGLRINASIAAKNDAARPRKKDPSPDRAIFELDQKAGGTKYFVYHRTIQDGIEAYPILPDRPKVKEQKPYYRLKMSESEGYLYADELYLLKGISMAKTVEIGELMDKEEQETGGEEPLLMYPELALVFKNNPHPPVTTIDLTSTSHQKAPTKQVPSGDSDSPVAPEKLNAKKVTWWDDSLATRWKAWKASAQTRYKWPWANKKKI